MYCRDILYIRQWLYYTYYEKYIADDSKKTQGLQTYHYKSSQKW